MDPSRLNVITAISNPLRYRSRYALYDRFQQQMRQAGINLVTVELQYGEREFECRHGYGDHLGIRLPEADIFWHKESLLNVGVSILPQDWQYMAWVDADIEFQNPEWAREALHRLQIFNVVQLWSHAQDLDPEHQIVGDGKPSTSFMYAWWNDLPDPSGGFYNTKEWHPGYGYAMTRDAYESVGGLFDYGILGAGDRHMAMSLVGKAERSVPGGITPAYRRSVLNWQALAERHIQRNVSYVPGLITHWWHGKKRNRFYTSRWQILAGNKFDPTTDLRRDWTRAGLLRWADLGGPRLLNLRDDVRKYFASRLEDSSDVE